MEPNLFADHGTLATGSIYGEFLNRTNANLTLAPELAVSWKPNAKGYGVDIPAPQRSQVRDRSGDEGRGCGRDVQAASRTRTAAAPRSPHSRASSQPSGVNGRRRLHRRLHAGCSDGEFPVPDEQHDLPVDHPSGRLQGRDVHDDAADDGCVQPRLVHARRRREVRPQPELVGRKGASRRRRRDVLRRRVGG